MSALIRLLLKRLCTRDRFVFRNASFRVTEGWEAVPRSRRLILCSWSARGRRFGGCRESIVAVVLGTERIVDGALLTTALLIQQDGRVAGVQERVQLDPSEEGLYSPGSGRRVFQAGPLTLGL